jgi:lysophospholipase L1-like esterase
MMPTRRLLLAAPALLLGGADRAPIERMTLAATPLSRMETPWWRARHQEKLQEIRGRAVDLVWLGDSITQNWERRGPPDWMDFAPVWQQFYGDRRAVNLGFKGDNTGHLLWRMQNGELDGIEPRAAVVLIGANNMGRVHWSAPQTLAGIDAVLAELHRRLPGTKALLIGVLPSIRSKWVTQTTVQVNHGLAARYGGGAVPDVAYIDLSAIFMRDGQVDRGAFYDDMLDPPDPPLHPTVAAQTRMAEAIEPALAAMLTDRSRTRR